MNTKMKPAEAYRMEARKNTVRIPNVSAKYPPMAGEKTYPNDQPADNTANAKANFCLSAALAT